jgi:hypothetical protein
MHIIPKHTDGTEKLVRHTYGFAIERHISDHYHDNVLQGSQLGIKNVGSVGPDCGTEVNRMCK